MNSRLLVFMLLTSLFAPLSHGQTTDSTSVSTSSGSTSVQYGPREGYSTSATSEGELPGEAGKAMDEIKEFIHNFGLYWGYYLEITPQNAPKNTLLTQSEGSTNDLQVIAQYAFFAIFGAIPVNTFFSDFVPADGESIYTALNAWANETFPSYASPSQNHVSVSTLIDQQTYQNDPVNQLLLNILGTPDYTFCMDYSAQNWNTNCSLLYQNKVARNVTGPLPSTDSLFSYDYQKQYLSQLNSNTLIAPLLYTTTSNEDNSTSSSSSTNTTASSDEGLTAKNQMENAANFIRYATGSVLPITQIKRKDYDSQWAAANPSSTEKETSEQRTIRENAEATLTNYLNSLRIYAARSSVAASNLYYILSKRLPQEDLNGSSQALNELQMATRRIYDPTKDTTQWLDKINAASPTTVEREIALLLSEINYQLYLNRQVEERLLLTNSMLLQQAVEQTKPSSQIDTDSNASTQDAS